MVPFPHTRRRLAVAALLVAAAGSAGEARGAVLAPEPRPTGVSAFGGRAVWSHFDERTRRYVLMTRAAGSTSRVPVASRRSPFDADLGPDRDGTVAAVYSRCRREAPFYDELTAARPLKEPEGCDLYKLRFAGGQERRLGRLSTRGASEVFPTLWRDRIAFVRRPDRRSRDPLGAPAAAVHVARRSGRRGERRLQAGPRQADRKVAQLDLRGRRLASSWSLFDPLQTCDERPAANGRINRVVTEVWLDGLDRRGRRIDRGCDSAPLAAVVGPALTATALLHTRIGSPSGPGAFLRRTPLAGGAPVDAALADEDGDALSYDEGTVYGLDRLRTASGRPAYRVTVRPDPFGGD